MPERPGRPDTSALNDRAGVTGRPGRARARLQPPRGRQCCLSARAVDAGRRPGRAFQPCRCDAPPQRRHRPSSPLARRASASSIIVASVELVPLQPSSRDHCAENGTPSGSCSSSSLIPARVRQRIELLIEPRRAAEAPCGGGYRSARRDSGAAAAEEGGCSSICPVWPTPVRSAQVRRHAVARLRSPAHGRLGPPRTCSRGMLPSCQGVRIQTTR